MNLQAIILDNKIFLPCTCIFEDSISMSGSVSYEIAGYVTPDLTLFICFDKEIKSENIEELNEDSPYRNFQFEDIDIEKLELPWKYVKEFLEMKIFRANNGIKVE